MAGYQGYRSNWFKDGKLNLNNIWDFEHALPYGTHGQTTQNSYVTELANNILAANGLSVMGEPTDKFRPALIQHNLYRTGEHRLTTIDKTGGITLIDYSGQGKDLTVSSVKHYEKNQVLKNEQDGSVILSGTPSELGFNKIEIGNILSVPNNALDSRNSIANIKLPSASNISYQHGARVNLAAETILGKQNIAHYQTGGDNVASLQVGKKDGKETGEFRLVVQDKDGKFTTASYNPLTKEIEWKKGQALKDSKLNGGEVFSPTDQQSEAFKNVVNDRVGINQDGIKINGNEKAAAPSGQPAAIPEGQPASKQEGPNASPLQKQTVKSPQAQWT